LAERHGIVAPRSAEAGALRRLAAAAKTTLVSYWLTPSRSFVWVIDGSGVRFHVLPAAADIERLVREHQAAIHNAVADPAAPGAAGEELFELLVAPIDSLVPPDGSVVIVADGALHGLNFETLPVPGGGSRYWIERAAVQMAPALALLAAGDGDGDGESSPASLLLIGNPTPQDVEFPALRYGAAEMTDIRRHFEGTRAAIYEGAAATPEAYRGAGPGRFSLVHFTAHAAANLDSPLDSAVILSGPAGKHKLYARDVAELPLRAELVTVSACRGAGERAFSGEGLVGFAWAFLRAGARRVVAGLWDVDDRSTAELMSAMYARLAAGRPPAQALRDAKLQLLRRGDAAAKPYYWAPFQLYTVSIP
jgi:CHAT domain-containing protein